MPLQSRALKQNCDIIIAGATTNVLRITSTDQILKLASGEQAALWYP